MSGFNHYTAYLIYLPLVTMDQVAPGVWIGDLQSALDVKGLKEKNIFSIVTAMRGKVTINAVRTTGASSPQVPLL